MYDLYLALYLVYVLASSICVAMAVITGVTTFLLTKEAYEAPKYPTNTGNGINSLGRKRRAASAPCLEAQTQLFNLTNRLTGNDVLTKYIEDMECYYGIKASANNTHMKHCEGTYQEDTFSFLNARVFAGISDCRKKNPKALGDYLQLIKQSIPSLNQIKDYEMANGNKKYHDFNSQIAVGLLALTKAMEEVRLNMLTRCYKIKSTAIPKFPKIFRGYNDNALVKARGKEPRQHAKRAFVVYNQIVTIMGTMRYDFWERRQCM
ncbi:uncharacterized protein LOC130641074 [Hydractinia symbiolongicarpus]|uniref:uncharacterized protein LOC130641074 n=1 Tax=Hydractinia symbiolongicarpus TaxID=13093 RepID=UPI00254E3264|nr:uncharacterized protein LOC130641074 [Hydractinia symbiolongicarpus]